MQVEDYREISNDLTFLFIKYPESLTYSAQLHKLYEKGTPIEIIEKIVSEKFGQFPLETDYEKRKFLEELLTLFENEVHIDVVNWYIDSVTPIYLTNSQTVESIVKLYREYKELRSKGETDVEEQDIIKAIKLSESDEYLDKVCEYLVKVKKSELFKRLFISEYWSEAAIVSHILSFDLTDEEFQSITDGEINLDRLIAIYEFLYYGLRGEEFMICSNPKLNVDQMYEALYGFRKGLTKDEVLLYAKPEYNMRMIKPIRSILEKKEYTKEEVERIINILY